MTDLIKTNNGSSGFVENMTLEMTKVELYIKGEGFASHRGRKSGA